MLPKCNFQGHKVITKATSCEEMLLGILLGGGGDFRKRITGPIFSE